MCVSHKSGLDISKHKTTIAPGDIKNLYQNRVLSGDNPTSLQCKVFFEICILVAGAGKVWLL